ncbi:hypothetical protein AA309_31160 [Microvirga vignae]|uniref:Uncharacterized protein n=1 Tax=Microvirga vignae TaxID=1225564 RepID=A0A0H1R2P4_9HYPH|nr:hypothetical protein [Microvirga vignae]KLK89470.1 hypothetical protein AA309_31160 [Microvirga vignae]
MAKEVADDTIELVAHAIYEAQQQACAWDAEPAKSKERFREYARNAIKLLNEDISVLLLALKQATAEQHNGGPKSAA